MSLTVEDAIRVWRSYQGLQVRSTLIDKDGARCAIGVLGGDNLSLVSTVYEEAVYRNRDISPYNNDDAVLIASDWGISEDLAHQIIQMNDDDCLTFTQIADRVERLIAAREENP